MDNKIFRVTIIQKLIILKYVKTVVAIEIWLWLVTVGRYIIKVFLYDCLKCLYSKTFYLNLQFI